jgi:hypothetical protein
MIVTHSDIYGLTVQFKVQNRSKRHQTSKYIVLYENSNKAILSLIRQTDTLILKQAFKPWHRTIDWQNQNMCCFAACSHSDDKYNSLALGFTERSGIFDSFRF